MILVTLGTQKEQFKRLLDYIEEADIKDEIIVQAGYTKYKSKKMKIFDFIPYEEMEKYIEEADLIITHAGTGSVLTPLKKGKKVIVCPRLSKFDEHIDDHQVELMELFRDEGYVLAIDENNSLTDLIKKINKFKPKKYTSNTDNFIKKLDNEINNTKKTNTGFWFNLAFIFILFLIISYFIPLTGDDWTNANFNTNNIFKILSIAYDKYFLHEGRFVSRVFVLFFTNTKWLWNIWNAIMITGIYYLSIKIIKPKNINLFSVAFILAMLLLENTMFTQSYLWVTGNCTYVLPMFMFLLYIYLINKIWDNKWNVNKITYFIIIFINLLIPTMVENISISLVIANILLLGINYFKFKKISKLLILNIIISIIGFLILYLSPGALIRSMEYEFYNYSILKKIITNIPNFINYTYIKNIVLIALIVVVINIQFLYHKKNNCAKFGIIFFLNIIPVLTIMANLLNIVVEKSSKARYILQYIDFTLDSNNIYIIIYWVFITMILLFINYRNLKESKNFKAMFFYVIGILANCAMLLSPVWGGRTALFTVFMLYINMFVLLNSFNINLNFKRITNLLYVCMFAYGLILLILYNSVYRQNIFRENQIKEQLINNNDPITIERFPDFILWNSNAYNEFHEGSFKKYYNIPENVEIERIKIGYKYFLIYEEKKYEYNK